MAWIIVDVGERAW
jgi:hypothetical protein